ncbi:aminoglycoside phosphotransferase family protein [Nocardioides solisilvae]|uniref:aminoglycoside phosphotransferase family protein n=1 Tax=Nocardioides solisilvae TaxID=1542435 RepID=UPI000D74059E|nr:aminoglycoside phosphotransferase family protein [Nocardioides solisilvae]
MPAGRPDGPSRRVPELCEEWRLAPDGDARLPGDASSALVLPVVADGGARAVLKVVARSVDAEREALALQTWHGAGAVRLLRADPGRRALLLERAGEGLRDHWDVEACEVIGSLYGTLHVPAPARVPRLAVALRRDGERLAGLPRAAPLPRRLVEQAVALGRQLAAEAEDGSGPDRLLHGALHFDHVLAAGREPWLVVSPTAVAGDPHAEPAPLLWHRWAELAGDVRGGLRRRFHAVVDAAGLDEDRARDWVVVRTLHRALRLLEEDATATGAAGTRDRLTACVTVAKAVQE